MTLGDAGRGLPLAAAGWRWMTLGAAGWGRLQPLQHRIRRISRTRVQSAAEFVVFLDHVCKMQPLELRIRRISRPRVQNAAEFVVFLEHVCKVLPFDIRIARISRARAHSAAVRYPNLPYFSNTCARRNSNQSYFSDTCANCSHLSSEFVVFREHVMFRFRARLIMRGAAWHNTCISN